MDPNGTNLTGIPPCFVGNSSTKKGANRDVMAGEANVWATSRSKPSHM